MYMYKKALILLALVLPFAAATAQRSGAPADTSRWDYHLSVGTTVVNAFGRTDALGWVAPSARYQATDRLTLGGGFVAVGSLLSSYELHGYHNRSLAPRRRGTRLAALHLEAEYRINDRLDVWASVARISGFAQPLWLDGARPVEATVLSGGLAYHPNDATLLELHFHIVHDHYGNAALGLFGNPWYGHATPNLDLYGGLWPF